MAFYGDFYRVTTNKAEFEASFTGGDASYAEYRYVKLTVDGDGTYQIRSNSRGGANSTFEETITGLDPGTRYYWEAQLGYVSSGSIVWLDLYDSGSFTTEEETINVDPWSWTSSNGSASSSQTRTAHNVLMGTETADRFSHLVWNDLVDKAYEVRSARGYTWDTDGGNYPSVSGCKVSAGETLSARKYNGVRYNIGSILSTGIFDQSPGDKITGYKIYHLTEVLNEIINDL